MDSKEKSKLTRRISSLMALPMVLGGPYMADMMSLMPKHNKRSYCVGIVGCCKCGKGYETLYNYHKKWKICKSCRLKEMLKENDPDMKVNANEETFENVVVLGYPMIFTCLRVDRSTVPDNLHVYDVRHDDECQGIPCELADRVLVNHWGTVISAVPIELNEDGANGFKYKSLNENDFRYRGIPSKLKDYIRKVVYPTDE